MTYPSSLALALAVEPMRLAHADGRIYTFSARDGRVVLSIPSATGKVHDVAFDAHTAALIYMAFVEQGGFTPIN